MATYTKQKNGWRAQIRKKGIYKSGTFRTKAEAQAWAWASKTESEIMAGAYSGIPTITFAELIDKYIKEISIHKKGAKSEILRLTRLCRMEIANVRLPDLCENDFINWRDQRLASVSPATVLREWNTLSSLINTAINDWKYLKENHLKNVKKPATPKERTRRYTDEEIEKLVYVSRWDLNYPPTSAQSRTGGAMLFAIETAMRAGEICNATWEDWNPEKRTLYIPMSKNGYPREVPLSSTASAILRHLESVKSEEDNRIFQINSATLDATFRKLKQLAGLDDADLHFHDTRREALSRLAKKVEVMTLAKISGHRDIKILLNTYYAPDMAKVVDLLD